MLTTIHPPAKHSELGKLTADALQLTGVAAAIGELDDRVVVVRVEAQPEELRVESAVDKGGNVGKVRLLEQPVPCGDLAKSRSLPREARGARAW